MKLMHTDPIEAYFELLEKRPDLFVEAPLLPVICTDRIKMSEFMKNTGKKLGIVYDNYPFFYVVADLCVKGTPDQPFYYSYARIVYPDVQSNGTVTIPYCNGKFGLISSYRHAPRQNTGWEFPRGFFDERAMTPLLNAHKELWEEMGIQPNEILKTTYLGDVRADAGLSSGKVQIYLTEIILPKQIVLETEEGIGTYRWVSYEEVAEMIQKEEIMDGFTLSALVKFMVSRQIFHNVG